MDRLRIFNATPVQRYKLFSGVEEEKKEKLVIKPGTRKVTCIDCSYEVVTPADGSRLFCPNCGGTRFETLVDKQFSRVSLFDNGEAEFQKEFSDNASDFELKLKEFSGKSLTEEEYQKEFSDYMTESELCERGFGEVDEDNNILISSDAFLMSRLFSSIKISITKSLELDPAMVCCENKGEVIDRLGAEGNYPTSVITLLKKAHDIPMHEENEAWMDDSGICKDLELEFGGKEMGIEEFKAIINERYPDAPEDVLDLLKKRGVIEVEGDLVKFK